MSDARTSRQLEWRLAEFQKAGPRESQVLDPTSAGAAQLRDLGRDVEILFGRVMDAIPYANTYKVLPERGLSVITCSYMTPGPNGAMGVRAVSAVAPGAHVWFLYHRDINYGVILGVESYFMTNPQQALSDYIYVGSRSGLHRDSAHSFPWRTNTRGLGDWSAGTPFDSTLSGEWGGMTRTGLRMIVDDYMAQIGAGEACGLYAYLWDQLCRLVGINLQIRSNCFEWEALDDESEHYEVRGHSTYPWETLGAGRRPPPGALYVTHSAKDTEIAEPWYGAVEPHHDDQMAVRRSLAFQGYLGQGGKRLVQAPTDGDIWSFGAPGGLASVFEEQLTLSGTYALRAAKSVIISRRPFIPKLYQKKRPEDKNGDTPENYKASSSFGGGPDHVVTGKIAIHTDYERNLARHAGVSDMMSYVFNWEAVHPFFYHQNEWHLGEESDTELGSTQAPSFGPLVAHGRMYIDGLNGSTLDIDHRYRTVDYALANSYFTLLDDGGVAIGDGYGSEIRMTGGSLHLTAPGDVWAKAGRNVGSWGGRDIVLRGGNCVDIAANKKDVRIKAEQHLWAVAGNGGGNGLLLLESQGTGIEYDFDASGDDPKIGEKAEAAGIVLRTAHGNIVNWGQEIYLRTGGGKVAEGNITLDASRGKKDLITNSNAVIHYMQPDAGSGRYDAFYKRPNDNVEQIQVKHAHAFTSSYTLLDSYLAVLGFLAVDGKYYGNDWIYLDTGHIATADSPDFDYLVPSIEPESFQEYFDQLHDAARELRDALQDAYQSYMIEQWYDDKRGGNKEVMRICEFSFRTSQQCRTLVDDQLHFRFFEDRWQQMDRLSHDIALKWAEHWSETQGLDTAAYPGERALRHPESYIEMPLTIFDPNTGTANARGTGAQPAACYANPTYGQPSPSAMNFNYRVLE
jgi:hypothetical protein